MKQKNLYLLVGVPASGKSTWANKKQKEINGIYVSRDQIRFAIVPEQSDYFSQEDKVFKGYVTCIQDGLDHNKPVIADATQLNENSRNKLLDKLNLEDTNITIVNFTTPLQECLKRNYNRTGRSKVPESAIINMYRSKTDPSRDVKYYYSEIIDVNSDGQESIRQ